MLVFQKKRKQGKSIKQENLKLQCLTESCGANFSSVMLLLSHEYENNHLDDHCCACDKKFTEVKNLRRHIKSLYLLEQYVCQQCPKVHSFNRRDNFFVHQLRFRGKVLCEHCGAGFTDLKDLKDHVTSRHTANNLC